jgi:bacterioferritin
MINDVTRELNTFLKGNYMAIHAYENYIHNVKNTKLKQVLQEIQQNHKLHAALVAERIQNLDGIPVDDVGMMGNAAKLMNKIKAPAKDSDVILKDALVGEHRGIEKSKELLNGDLDPESLALVESILAVDEQHVDLLDKFVH